ncbi:MAG: SHOCT domain-containing protein [Ardenticatenaceae bacterium]|nr:SHOCT domain-containing protein [Ardenticatenaceae bacterium]
MWWGQGIGWVWMIGMGLAMLLFWGGLIVLIVFGVQALARSGRREGSAVGSPSTDKTALDILKERYARGEITKAEYEEMRRDLAL